MATLRWLMLAWVLGAPPGVLAQASAPGAKSRAGDTAGQPSGLSESEVLSNLHRTNLMEMEAGGLAAARAQAGRVKQYGEQLIKDHRQADNSVQSFAKRRGVDLGTSTAPPGDSDQGAGEPPDEPAEGMGSARIEHLRTLNGAEFDRAFLRMMVGDHEDAIRMLRNARSQTQDPELRALLNKLLPVLQQHRDLAQRLSNTNNQSSAS